MKALLIGGTVAALALGIAGCSGVSSVTDDPSSSGQSENGGNGDNSQTGAHGQLGQIVNFEDGISVGSTKPEKFKPSESGFVDQPAFLVTWTVTNKGSSPYKPLTNFTSTASSGDIQCESGFDSAKKVDGAPDTPVLPGKSIKWRAAYGCKGAKSGSDITIAVRSDMITGDDAILTGTMP